ncbi:MAG: hypothetical protein P4M15_14670 [Alphaproteobacteria bacterium]|nr:hypothetical protein [Alphaproteobacteria bacterium]
MPSVIPAKAGTHLEISKKEKWDSRLRGNDAFGVNEIHEAASSMKGRAA